jgi:hypothetical protein
MFFFSLEFQSDEDDHDQISPSARPCSDERLLEFQNTSPLLTSPPASPRPSDHLVRLMFPRSFPAHRIFPVLCTTRPRPNPPATFLHRYREPSRSPITPSSSPQSSEGRQALHHHQEPPQPPRHRFPEPPDLAIDASLRWVATASSSAVRSESHGTDRSLIRTVTAGSDPSDLT